MRISFSIKSKYLGKPTSSQVTKSNIDGHPSSTLVVTGKIDTEPSDVSGEGGIDTFIELSIKLSQMEGFTGTDRRLR